MTPKQRAVLEFYRDFRESEGMSPTVAEVAAEFEISTSTAHGHIDTLCNEGFLARSGDGGRNFHPTDTGYIMLNEAVKVIEKRVRTPRLRSQIKDELMGLRRF